LPCPSQIPTALKFAGLIKDSNVLEVLSITLQLVKSIFLYQKNIMGGTHKGVTCWARDNLIKSILRVMEQKLFQSSINSSREVRKALEGTVDEPCRLTRVLVIIFSYMRIRIEAIKLPVTPLAI
jgi:hypothetical protein